MTEDLHARVDQALADLFAPPDPALVSALEASRAAGLPAYEVSPTQGKLLHLLALLVNARKILEVGTLGGYSTIWLARALPAGGRLITLEASAAHARVAAENIANAGLRDVVDIRVGPALETLPELASAAPFDLIFIDADKPNNPSYLEWALRLSRSGTLIVADNVVRGGAILDAASSDPSVQGVRRFNELLAGEPRVTATALQTVGMKGHDGLALARVN